MEAKISLLQPKEYGWVNDQLNQEKCFSYLPDAFTPLWSQTPDGLPKALWAITVAGELVGCAGYVLAETDRRLAWIGLIITPAYRRQGIGQQVYDALLAALLKRNVQRLSTRLYTHGVAGLAFFAHRGFCETGASFLSQCHVATAQPAAWGDPDTLAAAQGLHFTTLNRLPRAGLATRLLPLWNRTRPDQPQDWPYAPYSPRRFEQEILEADALALEHSYALVTANQQLVGLTLNTLEPVMQAGKQCLFTVYAAVDPDYRRRGLATALKLKLIAHAQSHNIAFLAAENDERNGVMWRINQRLGYRRLADLSTYSKIVGQ